MYSKELIKAKLRKLKPLLVEEFNMKIIGYSKFYSKSKNSKEYDLAILVELSGTIGWRFFTLEQVLSESIGVPVSLVTKNSIKERFKDHFLKQVQYV